MTFNIPDSALAQANIKPDELLIELAVYLYDKKALSWGKSRKLTGLDEMSFRKELAKRDVYLNYGVEELEKDLKTLGIKSPKTEISEETDWAGPMELVYTKDLETLEAIAGIKIKR